MTENAREDGEEDDFLIFGGLENIVTGDENRNGDDDSDGFRSGNANFETDIFETAGEAGEQEAAESEQQEPEEPESEQPGPLVSSIPGRTISREDVSEHLKKRRIATGQGFCCDRCVWRAVGMWNLECGIWNVELERE